MNDRAMVRSRGEDPGSAGIQGLEQAQETIVEFLTESVGKVKTDKLIPASAGIL